MNKKTDALQAAAYIHERLLETETPETLSDKLIANIETIKAGKPVIIKNAAVEIFQPQNFTDGASPVAIPKVATGIVTPPLQTSIDLSTSFSPISGLAMNTITI